jgi:hypothetical protein
MASSAAEILRFLSKRLALLLSSMQEGTRAIPTETSAICFKTERREKFVIRLYSGFNLLIIRHLPTGIPSLKKGQKKSALYGV